MIPAHTKEYNNKLNKTKPKDADSNPAKNVKGAKKSKQK